MTRHKLCAAFTAAALLLGCADRTSFGERLQHMAAQHVGRTLQIDAAVGSTWDEFAVFGPYFPKEEACEVLRLSAWRCFWLPYADSNDSAPHLLVFLHKQDIVLSAFLPRCGVQMHAHDAKAIRAPRRQGVFLVATDPSCAQPSYRLQQQ